MALGMLVPIGVFAYGIFLLIYWDRQEKKEIRQAQEEYDRLLKRISNIENSRYK